MKKYKLHKHFKGLILKTDNNPRFKLHDRIDRFILDSTWSVLDGEIYDDVVEVNGDIFGLEYCIAKNINKEM